MADLRGCFVSSLLRLMSSLRSSIDLVLSITNDDIQLDFSSAESAFMMMRGQKKQQSCNQGHEQSPMLENRAQNGSNSPPQAWDIENIALGQVVRLGYISCWEDFQNFPLGRCTITNFPKKMPRTKQACISTERVLKRLCHKKLGRINILLIDAIKIF